MARDGEEANENHEEEDDDDGGGGGDDHDHTFALIKQYVLVTLYERACANTNIVYTDTDIPMQCTIAQNDHSRNRDVSNISTTGNISPITNLHPNMLKVMLDQQGWTVLGNPTYVIQEGIGSVQNHILAPTTDLPMLCEDHNFRWGLVQKQALDWSLASLFLCLLIPSLPWDQTLHLYSSLCYHPCIAYRNTYLATLHGIIHVPKSSWIDSCPTTGPKKRVFSPVPREVPHLMMVRPGKWWHL